MRKIFIIGISILLAACSTQDDEWTGQSEHRGLHLTSSVNSFEGEDGSALTRTNIAGNAFANGDRMKLKIICPYSGRTEFGETTYGNSFDGLWLLKWDDSDWALITSEDMVDVGAGYKYSGSYDLFSRFEAQQTPYVYTASTWSENVLFIANGNLQSQYSYIFHADQTLEANYLKSDLLWAQTYMQTGSYDVHLSFNHVMACLKIDISALGLTGTPVVTLEGMPDIDQREVVVGDYYAAKSKVNSGEYGYKNKHTCSYENNGKVLGVAVIDDKTQKKALVRSIDNTTASTPIKNTGVYTAHKDGSFYYLIVPPCTLSTAATIWVRGEKVVDEVSKPMRYKYTLDLTKFGQFEQGKLYPVNIALPSTSTPGS